MAVSTIKAGSAGVDQSFTIATTAWSSTAPYTYTWSSDKITAGSRVTVDFYGTPAESSDVSYIEYEKVSVSNGYGIKFTSPVKPTVSISLVAHILNSKPLRLENITGADVSTSVISGAANVNEALSALNSKNLEYKLLGSSVGDITYDDISDYKFLYLTHTYETTTTKYSMASAIIPVALIKDGIINDFEAAQYEDGVHHTLVRATSITLTSARLILTVSGWGGVPQLYAIR